MSRIDTPLADSRPVFFGTDGLRGPYNSPHMNDDLARSFAYAFGCWVRRCYGVGGCVVVGRDTRPSGPALRSAIVLGLYDAGCIVVDAGIISTPALAYLCRSDQQYHAGVMITASHNLACDNGIKCFNQFGDKLSTTDEQSIEQLMATAIDFGSTRYAGPCLLTSDKPYQRYVRSLVAELGLSFQQTVVVDAANGSNSKFAPDCLAEAGCVVIPLNCDGNGQAINDHSGAVHPQQLAQTVRDGDAALGIAFDGDGDRIIMTDHHGNIVDGDVLLALLACHTSPGQTVTTCVGTVMTNVGVEQYLNHHGIQLYRTAVGDRHVLEKMHEADIMLGAESSGHVIHRKYMHSGDGLLIALLIINILQQTGKRLACLVEQIQKTPQQLVSLPLLPGMERWPDDPTFTRCVQQWQNQLAGRGQVVVRNSGTEFVVRIMVDALDTAQCDRCIAQLCDQLKQLAY